MAGVNRGPNWLVKTSQGPIPRAIATPEIRAEIEGKYEYLGKPELAAYFDTPYFVVKSWNRPGKPETMVLPCFFTLSGRARFLVSDVRALARRRQNFLDNLEMELADLRNREKEAIIAAFGAPGAMASGVACGVRQRREQSNDRR